MFSRPTVSFHTLGCKLNFAETSAISRQLTEAGFLKSDFDLGADVVVINTCSVTENADRECRSIVRKASKINPNSFIVVTGCYAQLKPEEISQIEGVDLVLGANEKFNIIEHLHSFQKKGRAEVHSCDISRVGNFYESYSLGDRTRAFLKVQDGCDYSCTYCTIPLARGASRSGTIAGVLKQVQKIAETGVKEIVLTGVNIGDFGITNQQPGLKRETFFDLVRALDKVEGIERFRISSIEPNLLKDEIIEFVASSSKFVPHFHTPLQSGSDKILKLMKRRYLRDLYVGRIEQIKSRMPNACIGADVITGFPGETDEDFLETNNFLNLLDVSYLHVFTYSEREDTEAIIMNEVVPVHIRRERTNRLRILSEKKLHHYYRENLGTTATVLFEESGKDGFIHGYTENYIRVKTEYNPALVHSLRMVELREISKDGMVTCSVLDLDFTGVVR